MEGAPPRAIERKVVTALFCDVVGSTELGERLDPEDIDRLLSTYHRLARRRIEANGGVVEKFIGDAVVGVFGAPSVHEDDPARAIRSALNIVRELEASRLGLEVRIGIQTGEAVVRVGDERTAEEGLATGDILNTAARLQNVAVPGGIAVGDPTYRLTAREFEWEDLGAVPLKGKAQPVQTWRPLRPRTEVVAGGNASDEATPFLGRDAELRSLLTTFERAVSAGKIELVTILAEPGMGKSRLVRELGRRLRDRADVTWRKGRCLPYGEGISYWALGEIVKADAGILESDDQATLAAKLDAAVSDADPETRRWLVDRLAPLIGLRTDAAAPPQEELFSAWTRFLTAMTASGPAVVVIEDLHWADPALVAFLGHLADATDAVPLLLVVTARAEVAERHPEWLARASTATLVQLMSLDDESIRVLLEQSLAGASPSTIAAVLERAAGSPLYAEQLAAFVRERGVGSADATIDESVVPLTLQALLSARIDALPSGVKPHLLDASVVGRVFWSGAVAAVGDGDLAAVPPALDELARRSLTRENVPSTVAGEAEYGFWHALLRDVAYSFLPRAARLAKHRAAATWITARAGGDATDLAEIVADHLRHALDLAVALDAQSDVPEIRADLAAALLAASERTLVMQPARAIDQLEAAMDLLGPEDTRRPAALARLGTALHTRGEVARALEAFVAARETYVRQGDALAAANLVFPLAEVLYEAGQEVRARAELEEARPILEANPGPGLVELRTEDAVHRARVDDPPGAQREADEALRLADSLGLPRPYRALMWRAICLLAQKKPEGEAEFRAAMELAMAAGDTRFAMFAMAERAQTMESVEALAAIDDAAAFATRYGLTDDRLDGMRIDLLDFLGRWDELLEAIPPVLARAAMRGDAGMQFGLEWIRAIVAVERMDRPVDLDDFKGQAMALGFGEQFVHGLRARIPYLQGDYPAARDVVVETLEELPERETVTAVFFVTAAIAAGGLALARRVLARSYPESTPRQRGMLTKLARGLVLEAEGNLADARPLFEESAAWFRGRTRNLPARESLFALGRAQVRQGEIVAGLANLREARAIAETLRTPRSIAEIDAAIDAAHVEMLA